MVQKVCSDCQAVFEYEPNPNYPDRRKYCDDCSAVRKAQWDAKQTLVTNPIVQPKPLQQQIKAVQTQAGAHVEGQISTQIQIVRNERPNSYEFGKAGNRFKIYFEDKDDLQIKIDELMGLRIPLELVE